MELATASDGDVDMFPSLSVREILELGTEQVWMLYLQTRERSDGPNSFRTLTPAEGFWTAENFDHKQSALGMRACLALWHITGGKRVPRLFQLSSTIRLMSMSDGVVNVGTGKGKTYCLLLPCLIDPSGINLVLSPLKSLEGQQIETFLAHGIKAILINSDSDHSPEVWKARRISALLCFSLTHL